MKKYGTLEEDVDVQSEGTSVQNDGGGFEIAAGQVRVPKSTGVRQSQWTFSTIWLVAILFEKKYFLFKKSIQQVHYSLPPPPPFQHGLLSRTVCVSES